MSNEKTYDPFEGFKLITGIWEKQFTNLLFRTADNKPFVRTVNLGLDAHSRYMELLRRNQEIIAGLMNIPTKKDVAKVAKLSIQAEEKIDLLEEQLWTIQDRMVELNKENLKFLQEVVQSVNLLKGELEKNTQELAASKSINSSLQKELAQLADIKKDISELKGLVGKEKKRESKKELDKELVLTGSDKQK